MPHTIVTTDPKSGHTLVAQTVPGIAPRKVKVHAVRGGTPAPSAPAQPAYPARWFPEVKAKSSNAPPVRGAVATPPAADDHPYPRRWLPEVEAAKDPNRRRITWGG